MEMVLVILILMMEIVIQVIITGAIQHLIGMIQGQKDALLYAVSKIFVLTARIVMIVY